MNKNNQTELNFALQQDKEDPLKDFRKSFFIADENVIYMDGNSLGRLPEKTKAILSEVVEKQWGTHLIKSWNQNWYFKSAELGNKIAKIIGASDGEVIVTDSTSVNLFKLASAALKFQKDKNQLVSDVFNFPTDLYILQGILQNAGTNYELVLARSSDEISIDTDYLKQKITENTALVVLSLVAFKSSYLYNMEEITSWAHSKGSMVLWDLSHAAGAIPVKLNESNADLAVGCTYKYLNGGPGSPAFLYVRKDLQEKLSSPIQGWFGDSRPFEFDLNYEPAAGIQKFLAGTPPVISQMAIEPGVDLILEAGVEKIDKKSRLQSQYFIDLVNEVLLNHDFKIGSPLLAENRGSHISLKHIEAYRICQALIHPKNSKLKIIPDFREPNNIRFGITPLYTSFNEVWQTVIRLKEIVETAEFEQFNKEKNTVT